MKKEIGEKLKKPKRLSDDVADILRAEIEKGSFKPGERLPTESELSKNFDVSRTVIREALSRLHYDGLIATRQGRGAHVTKMEDRKSFRLESPQQFTKKDYQHLIELRIIVEMATSFLAAQRRTKANLKCLKKHLDSMEEAVRMGKDGTDPDLEFHLEIARCTKNPYLAEFLQYINARLRSSIQVLRNRSRSRPGATERVQKDHELLYEAIEGKNADLARSAMEKQLYDNAALLRIDISHFISADRMKELESS